jgi:subtilisin family serine protease
MQRNAAITFILALALASTPLFAGERPQGKFFTARGEAIPGEYLVVFASGVPVTELAAQVASDHTAVIQRIWSHAVDGALLGNLTEQRARAIARRPDVRWVEENQVVTLDASQADPPSWGLDRIEQRDLPLDDAYDYDFDGTGVHLYVIDTGIRPTHEDFGGRASAVHDTIGDGKNGIDCHGHGTHVAGTAGGSSFGVAKAATIYGVRVLDCFGNGTVATVVDGIDWVTGNHQSPAVANMSLGGSSSPTLDAAVDNSVAAGVFHVVAAGNESTDACTRSPAGAASAFTVASTTITDARSWFSNFGTCVDVFAPGSSITSAWHTSDTATATLDGTSMASPHAAGAAALLLDESPGLTPAQVGNELIARATCGMVSDPGVGSSNRLLYTLDGTPPPCPPPPPNCDVTTLDNAVLGGTETHGACRLLNAGPSLIVTNTASVILEAGATVALFDGFQVDAGGTLKVRSCGHSLCSTGAAVVAGCHSCAEQICAVDSWCCTNNWDSLCVSEVASVCGLSCS